MRKAKKDYGILKIKTNMKQFKDYYMCSYVVINEWRKENE